MLGLYRIGIVDELGRTPKRVIADAEERQTPGNRYRAKKEPARIKTRRFQHLGF
jgi:hypothetical protein